MSICSINSFNYWGEGTQIEPARPVHAKERFEKTYIDYESRGPYAYLHIAKDQSDLFGKQLQARPSISRARRDYDSLAGLHQQQADLITGGVGADESAADLSEANEETDGLDEVEALTSDEEYEEVSGTETDTVNSIDDMSEEKSARVSEDTFAATSGHNSDPDDDEYIALREL